MATSNFNQEFGSNMSVGVCPICSKQTVEKYKPFCSLRCANEDLSKWLDQRYFING